MESLSKAQARRVALAAQGFRDPAHARVTARTLDRAIGRTQVFQVDSVNVFARAHLMPLYSRAGEYSPDVLAAASAGPERRLVEYFVHVQALMDVELWPLMRQRMDHYRETGQSWGQPTSAGLLAEVLDAVRARGPVTAADLDAEFSQPRGDKEAWGWNWSQARSALHHLYLVGDVAIAGRTSTFEVRYDVPERVLPQRVLATPVPSREDAVVELVRRAARSHGVGSARCLADYHRLRVPQIRPALAQLVEAGELIPVEVEGWGRPAYLHRDAALPRKVTSSALLSPFDPLVWERDRTEALFDFHYRIEIYVPEHLRVHGYYVLPFLLDERLVARVDLKADRRRGALVVRAAYGEPDAPAATAGALAAELLRAAAWQGLDVVEVEPRGDLAPALHGALGS